MKRHPDWQGRLAQHAKHAASRTFAWGSYDCALAVCDAIRAQTGTDVGAAYRGKYSTAGGALKITGADLGAFAASVAQANGFAEVAPRFARRGDVVLVENGHPQKALGVVDLSGRFALCAGQRGLERLPMRTWLRAWRIG